MRAATLFSGIGAPECARPGWDWLWCAEVEAFPSAVHAARHGCPNLGDVTAPDFTERARAHGPLDALVFGSPCQSFSVAGQRLGLDDPRGNLALVALRLARELRPEWLVFENVPGLLSSANGDDLAAFLGLAAECGYFGAWRVLDAQYFGVPQRRRRLFAVLHLGDWRRGAAVLFEPRSLHGDTAPRRSEGANVAALTAHGVGTCGPDDNQAQAGHLIACATGDRTHALTAEGHDASEDGTGRGTPVVAFTSKDHGADAGDLSPTLRAMGHGASHANGGGQVAIAIQERAVCENPDAGPQGTGVRDDDLAYTLEARNKVQAVAFDLRGRDGGAMPEGPHPTANIRAASGGSSRSYLVTGPVAFHGAQDPDVSGDVTHPVGRNHGQETCAMVGTVVRRLTPTECERLQGFPDGFTLVPQATKGGWRDLEPDEDPDEMQAAGYAVTLRGNAWRVRDPDGPRYKALGNSMAVPVLRWILARVEAAA